MKTLRRTFVPIVVAFAAAPLALAHPGHDDGHELTWDFGHLAAHPGATIMCFAVVGLAAWVLWRETRAAGWLKRKEARRNEPRGEN